MSKKKAAPRKKKPSQKLAYAWRLVKRVMLIFFASTIFMVILYRFVNPPITWLMIQRGIERKVDGKDWKLVKDWRDFDEISDNLKRAAVGGEDATFLQHWGFDLKGIEMAWEKNQKGKKLRGGSTISQQTAKNVFLWPSRDWIRKGFETYFTCLIELFWSKQRILEVYLNVVETGDGLYGVEAASRKYFGKSAANLDRNEASLLIAILPSPRRWSAVHPTRFVYYKQSLILRNMRRMGKLSF